MSVWEQVYDGGADSYAAVLEPTFVQHAERVVELAGARPGVRMLDLATGTGTIARLAAARGAAVVGVDVSPRMLEIGHRIAPALDLRVADASALPFPDRVCDVVTCGLAVTHFAEREQALSEVLRVLRPGGRFVASTWAEGGSNPARTAAGLLDRYVARAEQLDEGTWAATERGCDILRSAGFAEVSVETDAFECTFNDAIDALAWIVASPVTSSRLGRLEPALREQFFAEAHEALAGRSLTGDFAFNFYVALTA